MLKLLKARAASGGFSPLCPGLQLDFHRRRARPHSVKSRHIANCEVSPKERPSNEICPSKVCTSSSPKLTRTGLAGRNAAEAELGPVHVTLQSL